MTDHYETLGVGRGASLADIKRAYRRKAQVIHPDKDGGVGEFQALQEAYATLSDPDRREQYDKTGQGSRRNLRAEAETSVASLLSNTLEQNDNTEFMDLIKGVREFINNQIMEVNQSASKLATGSLRLSRAMKRLRRKQGNNLAAQMMESRIASLNQQAAAARVEVQLGHLMLEVLAEYEYEFTVPHTVTTATSGANNWVKTVY